MTNEIRAIIAVLKLKRIELGMSQRELARRVEVSHVSIGYWESGRVPLYLHRVYQWADALDLKLEIIIK